MLTSKVWAYRLAEEEEENYIVARFEKPVCAAEARETVRSEEQLADDEEFDLWAVEVAL